MGVISSLGWCLPAHSLKTIVLASVSVWFAIVFQVLPKLVPFDVILADRDLSYLYVNGQLERQAAHGNLRSLATALEHLLRVGIRESILPDDVLVRRLLMGEQRVRLHSGIMVIVNTRTEQVRPLFPLGWSCQSMLTINHTIDRGSVGAAAMNFCVSRDFVWIIEYGLFHDL